MVVVAFSTLNKKKFISIILSWAFILRTLATNVPGPTEFAKLTSTYVSFIGIESSEMGIFDLCFWESWRKTLAKKKKRIAFVQRFFFLCDSRRLVLSFSTTFLIIALQISLSVHCGCCLLFRAYFQASMVRYHPWKLKSRRNVTVNNLSYFIIDKMYFYF